MAASQMNTVLRHLRRAALNGDAATLTDGQLLDCFIRTRDDTAFATLVRRHGPMVLGLCRRIAGNVHDADDAFQAAFLVLVRKARSVVPREMVGNWLYGVAYHTALKARASADRRRGKEKQVTDMTHPECLPKETDADLLARLDREVRRLPDKYRLPVVLCELEGRSRKEVANQLGLPEGTLSSRLAKARQLLAQRLGGSGLALGAGVATAAVSATLLETTVQAAALTAAGRATTDVVSANITLLTEGVLKAMLLTKLKIATATILVLGLVVCGSAAGWYGSVAQAEAPAGEQRAKPAPPQRTPDPLFESAATAAPRRQTDEELLQGKWRAVEFYRTGDQLGQKVTLSFGPEGLYAEFKGNKFHVGTNDVDASTFTLDTLSRPRRMTLKVSRENDEWSNAAIYELDGDDLKICMSGPNDEYPKSFDVRKTADGKVTSLMILKRSEPIRTTKPTAKTKTDVDLIQGTWGLVRMEREKREQPDIDRTVTIGPTTMQGWFSRGEVTYTLDPNARPKRMRWVFKNRNQESIRLSIYELNGDDLKICIAPFESEQYPERFETKNDEPSAAVMYFKRLDPAKVADLDQAKEDAAPIDVLLKQNAALLDQNTARIEQITQQRLNLERESNSLEIERQKLLADQTRLKYLDRAKALAETKDLLQKATKTQPNDKALKTLDDIEKLIQEMKKELKEKEGKK